MAAAKDGNDRKAASRHSSAAPEKVTIRELAAACGVAVSTASNALAGQRFVAGETRERILAMAEKMGYHASAVARSLRLRRSWSIGILVGDITNPFFPELVRGAEDVAAAENYNLILCNTDYRTEKQDSYLRLLADKQIDGLIIASQVRKV